MIAGAGVQATVVEQIKGDKVIHFVKRRRKHGSQRTKGHRQKLTLIKVTDILTSGADATGVKAAIGAGSAPRVAAPAKAARKSGARASGGDDLKLLSGVGPALAKKLHDSGVTTYAQIAAWTESDVAAMDEKLSFKGRIQREGWIAQAAELAKA